MSEPTILHWLGFAIAVAIPSALAAWFIYLCKTVIDSVAGLKDEN